MDSIPLSIELPSEFHKCELDIATLKALKGDQGLEDGDIISRLEDTIIKHSRALAFYQGHLNVRKRGLNTILPREILSEVFYVIARHDFSIASASRRRTSQSPRLSWLGLAHVCRYWRSIVLTSPRIFSFMYLPARSREHLQACLYYSRQAPLSVKYRDCSVRDKVHKQLYSQWLLLLPHLGRARSADLEINLANTTETQLILPFSQTLTTLMLTDPFIRKPPALELAGKTIDRIFSVLPNLQHFSSDLHTLGYSDWTERAFPPSLKVLIINHSASGDQTPSLQHLISALQKLPYLRQLQFEGLRSGDYSYSSSNALSMASTPRLERLHLDGHHAPCTSILSRTDYTRRLYLRPRLHLRGNRLVMDLFLDSLTGLFQRQGLPSEESYVLVLHAWAPDGYRLRTHLKVRPAGSGSVIPRKILSQMLKWGEYTDLRHSNSCSRFDIAATVIPKEGRDENWETMRLRRDSAAREFYRRSLPFFPHVQALVIGLDADGYTTKCTWDAVAPLTNNIQSLQIVVKDMPYQHKEPGGRILEFPLKLCEMENGKNDLDNGQVPFPSLRVLSISVPLAVGSKDTTRTFLENLRIALEARKARGYGLMKLMLDVSLEKDQLENQFRHLVEIFSMEEDYDWNDSEFE